MRSGIRLRLMLSPSKSLGSLMLSTVNTQNLDTKHQFIPHSKNLATSRPLSLLVFHFPVRDQLCPPPAIKGNREHHHADSENGPSSFQGAPGLTPIRLGVKSILASSKSWVNFVLIQKLGELCIYFPNGHRPSGSLPCYWIAEPRAGGHSR